MEDIFSSGSIQILLILAVLFFLFQQFVSSNLSVRDSVDIGEENSLGFEEMPNDASGICQKGKNTLAVLAYGTGKMEYGKVAALTSVKVFLENFSACDVTTNISYFFNKAINQSNREILENLKGVRSGTAVSATLISEGCLYYASVGDIKIVLMRNSELIPVNDGHNMKTATTKAFLKGVLSREQAIKLAKTEKQTNYLGRDGFKNPEFGVDPPVKLVAGDIIILMTNSIYKCVPWIELENILSFKATAQHLAEKIIAAFDNKVMPDKKSAGIIVLKYKR